MNSQESHRNVGSVIIDHEEVNTSARDVAPQRNLLIPVIPPVEPYMVTSLSGICTEGVIALVITPFVEEPMAWPWLSSMRGREEGKATRLARIHDLVIHSLHY